MENSAVEIPEITEMDGVRKVVVRQFELHETRHLQNSQIREEDSGPVEPKAHQMADIYKCLHQATFGYYKHIPSEEFFRRHLADDYFSVPAKADAHVLESVSSEDTVFRVNLRPYRKAVRGYDKEGFFVLEKVVLQSSLIEKGSKENFYKTLGLFRDLNNGDGIRAGGAEYRFSDKIVEEFLAEFYKFIEIYGVLPLFSHSKTYHVLNEPAYVVADLAIIERSPLQHFL